MIILASKSASRQAMLRDAGVPFEARPADLDERAIEATFPTNDPALNVVDLSVAKALAVAEKCDAEWVLGSDSMVVVEGRRFDKPTSRENAAEHLRFFSGKKLTLHAGAALVRNGHLKMDCHDAAVLSVRSLSEDFIQTYLDQEWPAVSGCVGVFRIEGLGVQLFDHIEGNHFTILGMPLLRVLWGLRQFGVMPK